MILEILALLTFVAFLYCWITFWISFAQMMWEAIPLLYGREIKEKVRSDLLWREPCMGGIWERLQRRLAAYYRVAPRRCKRIGLKFKDTIVHLAIVFLLSRILVLWPT